MEQTLYAEDNKVYRNNFILESSTLLPILDVIYSLCVEFVTKRTFGPHDVIFMGFKAEEHFEESIGKVEIPK